MELADFLGGPDTEPAPQPPDPEVDPAEAPEAPEAVEPQYRTSMTPSGIEVLYQWHPKRLYRVRRHDRVEVSENGPKWVEVPSVSTVLGIVDKSGALTWWGMKVGVKAMLDLYERGLLVVAQYDDGTRRLSIPGAGAGVLVPATVENVCDKPNEWTPSLLSKERLTVNHVRDEAADRGTNVHGAFENWAERGVTPHPELYEEHERGYVEGLLAFLRESGVRAEATEVMVGSVEEGFAGRYDLRGELPEDVELVVHRTPKRGDQRELFPAGKYLFDLKTSKDFYETHFIQLEGYEGASVESGWEPTMARAVIVVDNEGRYKIERSKATYEDFLAVKACSDALANLKKRRSKRAKKKETKS